MKSFVQQIAEHLVEKHSFDFRKIKVVFPNRRVGLFLKKELATLSNQPFWAPETLSIEDFVVQLSTSTIPSDPLSLVFELYRVYCKEVKPESFENFYHWGQMLLRDFDEIDKNLVDANQLYKTLHDLKELDATFTTDLEDDEALRKFWATFSGKPISSLQQKFLDVWEKLGQLHFAFKLSLREKNMAYPGMVYRQVIESESGFDSLKKCKVYLCGFNALSKVETRLFQILIEKGMAEMLWDIDRYYLDDIQQEAGRFLRRQFHENFPQPSGSWMHNNFIETDKEIEMIGAPMGVGQGRLAAKLLAELMKEPGFLPEKTAIVLPDESLMVPLLLALPENLDAFNLTMGHPAKRTSIYGFVNTLLQLHACATHTKKQTTFRYGDVAAILLHPFVFAQIGNEGQHLLKAMRMGNIMFVNSSWVNKNVKNKALKEWLQPVPHFTVFLQQLKIWLIQISSNPAITDHIYAVEKVAILHFYKLINRLQSLLTAYDLSPTWKAGTALLQRMISVDSITYEGKPVQGLQIMGLLETRNVDFENVIMLSVNESVLPASRKHHSYIPYNVRKAFDLPTYEDHDAISAYIFYRSMQKAKRVFLLYDTVVGDGNAKEKSRFLQQLKYELPLKNPKATIKESVLSLPLHFQKSNPISIQKCNDVLRAMKRFVLIDGKSEHYISPSALGNYITCPLKFYLRNVMKLYEPDEVAEEVDALWLGNIVHHTLENLYGDFIEEEMPPRQIHLLRKQVEPAIRKVFKEEYSQAAELEGQNIIVFEVVKKVVESILTHDEKDAKEKGLKILALETGAYSRIIKVVVGEEKWDIVLSGKIDRLDQVDGVVRVIDYKTGKEDLKAGRNNDTFSNPKKKARLQALLYAWLYLGKHRDRQVLVGIYAMRNLGHGLTYLDEKPISANDLIQFDEMLCQKIGEIFDSNIPFTQTEDESRCTYCDFVGICGRESGIDR